MALCANYLWKNLHKYLEDDGARKNSFLSQQVSVLDTVQALHHSNIGNCPQALQNLTARMVEETAHFDKTGQDAEQKICNQKKERGHKSPGGKMRLEK